jgi:glutamate-1-semialdehyde 2,1-aminomutase
MSEPDFDAFRRLTPGSASAWRLACERIPGGVSSNVRYFPPYPIFMSRASGSKIYDIDNREYIDYCLAFGPLVAGHGHPRVLEAIRSELDRAGTVIFGASSTLEGRMAENLARLLPSAEMTRFTNSGTEATMHAVRIARGVTGRTRIAKFEGHYHGVHDSVLVNTDGPVPVAPACDGIPAPVLGATLVLPFNDAEAVVEALEKAEDLAAVILEPVARGAIEPAPDFLRAVREVTSRRGVLLIFDEVVSWPRVGPGGAQVLYGVVPDLTTLGKAIGGGLPMGAVVGRRDVMNAVWPKSAREAAAQANVDAPEPGAPYVFHGGTYNGTPLALAAGLAVLDLLENEGGWGRLKTAGERMRSALVELFLRRGREAQVIGTGAAFDFYFTGQVVRSSREIWESDLDSRRAIDYRLLCRGIYNSPVHRFHLSLAHTDADLERTLEEIDRALDVVRPGEARGRRTTRVSGPNVSAVAPGDKG